MLIIWSDLDLFRVWMSWMWTWTTWTWMTLTPLMLTWMMTSWMIKISPAHFRTYLNKKRDQTPPFPFFCICMKNVILFVSWSDGMKEDSNDDISHVLFSNKIDKSVYQSPFCTHYWLQNFVDDWSFVFLCTCKAKFPQSNKLQLLYILTVDSSISFSYFIFKYITKS